MFSDYEDPSLIFSRSLTHELELRLIQTQMAQKSAAGKDVRACVAQESKREESRDVGGRTMRLVGGRGVVEYGRASLLIFRRRYAKFRRLALEGETSPSEITLNHPSYTSLALISCTGFGTLTRTRIYQSQMAQKLYLDRVFNCE